MHLIFLMLAACLSDPTADVCEKPADPSALAYFVQHHGGPDALKTCMFIADLMDKLELLPEGTATACIEGTDA